MDLERIAIEALKSKEDLDKVNEEAYQYGVCRGGTSASGDEYALLGGPQFDDVLKDYLAKKFGMVGSLRQISVEMQQIPSEILDSLEKGFKEGYRDYMNKNEDD